MFVAGPGKDLWSKMPQLTEGHEYLLLISHFTQTQSGYSFEFHRRYCKVLPIHKIPAAENVVGSCKGSR